MTASSEAHDPSSAPPSATQADELLEALGRLRGRRGHRGGPGAGHGGAHGGFPGVSPDSHHRHDQRGTFPTHPGAASDPEDGHDWAAHGQRGLRERSGGPALLRLLATLLREDTPLSVSELAALIGVDQPRASRLVQQAVERGHAEREADPHDARRTRVRITDSGKQMVHGIRGRQRDDATTALRALAEPEREELLRLLDKLADAWPQPRAPRP
ncbi:MarR family winged helix-turn-helix transcriptional regulator [Leucobacter sp. G161]|uniref:MarR family winged helix-turn-helix transcriptional regulator n=1 Tax=Leucobacter sp. G161 TaxID=663704 RepID=UPI0009F901E3|nr:MarR family winged helix-turn-helix transcriptional regulator [Leucobacter sp. G161]